MPPVMTWQEHALRSLYKLRLDKCAAGHDQHSMIAVPLVESEVMLRLNCRWCTGSAWVAWRPMADQGADPDEFIAYVEGLINDPAGQSAKAI